MTRKPRKSAHQAEPAEAPVPDPTEAPAEGSETASAELEAELARLTNELAELEDRHLRLAAEFDNFRKRTARERAEHHARAQAELVARLVEFLDDLDRVAELDPGQVSAADVVEGVALADRKLRRQLEAAGLERIGAEGEPFDPNVMEAMGSIPTDDPARDHTAAIVFQPGYRFGGQLVRPARVQVYMVQDGGGAE